MNIPAKKALFGAAYGIALVALSAVIGGGGHGIYTPRVIVAAPLPSATGFPMSLSVALVSSYVLLGPPVLWAAIATLNQVSLRWLFPVSIAVHYASAIFYVLRYWNDDFNDPSQNSTQVVRYEAPYLVAFAAVYICGQIWLWRSFVKYSPGEHLPGA